MIPKNIYNTACNVWINANAGSGKTTVLINRILALMLDKNDISSILCLTYTKNAAQEIYERLVHVTQRWYHATAEELTKELKEIIPSPRDEHFYIARQMLPQLLLKADDIDISTIHAFCYKVMQTYHASHGSDHRALNLISPWHISSIKRDITKQILNIIEAKISEDGYTAKCLNIFTRYYNINKLQSIIAEVLDGKLHHIKNNDLDSILELPRHLDYQELAKELLDQLNLKELHNISQLMLQCRQSLAERGAKIAWWLQLPGTLQLQQINVLLEGLLNKEMLPLSQFPTKALAIQYPNIATSYNIIAANASAYASKMLDAILYQTSFILPYLADNIQHLYKKAKESWKVYDFQELLTITQEIINQPGNLWLLQKIDSKIRHVLIDEAQDTNPLSWDIIAKTTEEFFSGSGAYEGQRTILVVGDEKQSIFSFQGANLEFFLDMKEHFAKLSQQASIPFITADMNDSYRSCSQILAAIDKTFSDQHLASCITQQQSNVRHNVAKINNHKVGIVKTITVDCCAIDSKPQSDASWLPEAIDNSSNTDILLNTVIDLVKNLLNDGNQADDMMIILRNREGKQNFAFKLLELLQLNNIKTAGIDKFKLSNHLVYRDVLSLYQFIATPFYDLNTACLLHSPIVGMKLDLITDICLEAKRLHLPIWQLISARYPKEIDKINETLLSYQKKGKLDGALNILLEPSLTERYHCIYGHSGVAVLHQLVVTITEAQHLNAYQLIDYLENVDLTLFNNIQPGSGVRIMTIHAAKGLESKIVILVDTETDIMRSVNMKKLNIAIIDDNNALLVPKSELRSQTCKEFLSKCKYLEFTEEMRLLYVAMSRAQEQLYIVGPNNDNKEKYNWVNIVKT